mgnify:CR=1 FL=1
MFGEPYERDRRKVACGVVLLHRGRVPLIRRADGLGVGFPFGKHDYSETFPETAARELFEETGYIVRPDDLSYVCGGQVDEYVSHLYAPKPWSEVRVGEATHASEGELILSADPFSDLSSRHPGFSQYNRQGLFEFVRYCERVRFPVPFPVPER